MAMIFAPCGLAFVLIVFLICILRKTYCPSTRPHVRHRVSSSGESGETAGAGIPFNIRPPYEKPPSYEESQRSMISLIGTPPPEYPEQLLPISFEYVTGTSDQSRVRESDGVQRTTQQTSGTQSNAIHVGDLRPGDAGLSNRAFQPD